jgi:RNA polymerase sigma-70 factor (ECF subfamily)
MNAALPVFQEELPRLRRLAYRLMGSTADADDIVQDAYVRVHGRSLDGVAHAGAYLDKVVTRLALDKMKSAQRRREVYAGPWLPEPVLDERTAGGDDISMALMVLLERLSEKERACFVLHESLGYAHAEIAEMLGISHAAARQAFSRAHKAIGAERARFASSRAQHERLLDEFLRFLEAGDVAGLMGILAPGVRLQADGGAKLHVARKPVDGPDHVARYFHGLRARDNFDATPCVANGEPALRVRTGGGRLTGYLFMAVHAGAIERFWFVLNPDKIRP